MKDKFFKIFQYNYLLQNLISRDIKVKYRRSVLGIIWSVLNPLLMMLVITTVFSQLYKINVENFHVYYLSGFLIYNFFSEATSSSLPCIISSASLIKKVYIPKYIFPLERNIFSLINLSFSMIAVLIVMLITGVNFSLKILLFPIPIFFIFIFSLGISLLLSALTVFLRDIIHIYSVVLTAWMYATPIIYPSSQAESIPILKFIMHLNPLYYFVEYFRDIVLYDKIPSIEFQVICVIYSFITLFIGIIFFKKNQDKFVLYL